MGSCGCGSEDLLFRFPGPEGVTYAFEVYDSCHYCGTPAGAVLYRIDADGKYPDIGEQMLELVPEVEFKGDFCVTQVAVPVVDPSVLFDALTETMGDEVDDTGYVEGLLDSEIVAYALPDAVRRSLEPFTLAQSKHERVPVTESDGGDR